MAAAAPIRVLVAALGGEGGGVLSSWMHAAMIASGHFVQGTFIPGVAQRTGATTYYLEAVPEAGHRHTAGAARPVLALNAAPGEVDLVVASELLEAVRAIQAGYVTPDRTVLIASTARIYTVDEKAAMADGRLDQDRMLEAARRFSRQAVLADFAAAAAEAKAPLNAVLLGAIAATDLLPVNRDAFRAAIRAEGKSVEANLRGFEAGLSLVPGKMGGVERSAVVDTAAAPTIPQALAATLSVFPVEVRATVASGAARLVDYQGELYARRYLDRLIRFVGKPGADASFLGDLARHLAVRMSVEDVIRVAQLKLRDARILRVEREAAAGRGEIIDITEYMKPGAEEVLGLLPARLGRWAMALVAARGWEKKSWPLKIRTTRLTGFLRLRMLAGLKAWRPRTHKFAQENAWVERWLDLVERTLAVDAASAREVVATAALVRGYGDTYRRGLANWSKIAEEVVEPMLRNGAPRALFADAVLQARLAASKDPEGEALAQTVAAISRTQTPAITTASAT